MASISETKQERALRKALKVLEEQKKNGSAPQKPKPTLSDEGFWARMKDIADMHGKLDPRVIKTLTQDAFESAGKAYNPKMFSKKRERSEQSSTDPETSTDKDEPAAQQQKTDGAAPPAATPPPPSPATGSAAPPAPTGPKEKSALAKTVASLLPAHSEPVAV